MDHIIDNNTWPHTFCGEDTTKEPMAECIKMNTIVLLEPQVARNTKEKAGICKECLSSPDYALFLLATTGDDKDFLLGVDEGKVLQFDDSGGIWVSEGGDAHSAINIVADDMELMKEKLEALEKRLEALELKS